MIKYKSFSYAKSGNIGDEVQSFGTELHLPTHDGFVDRDNLVNLDPDAEKFALIMNGWYSNDPKNCLPAADCVVPIFWGFHLNHAHQTDKYFLSGERLEYLKKHQPIGCRDPKTTELLQNAGVEAFYSKCLTHTFPLREQKEYSEIILADVRDIPVPQDLFDAGRETTQFEKDYYGNEIKRAKAKVNLDLYKNAKLVITSKIHCAMPCVAMGVPVIYFGNPSEYRVQVLKDMGVTVYKKPHKIIGALYRVSRNTKLGAILRKLFIPLCMSDVDWNPVAIDYEEEKKALVSKLQDHMASVLSRNGIS